MKKKTKTEMSKREKEVLSNILDALIILSVLLLGYVLGMEANSAYIAGDIEAFGTTKYILGMLSGLFFAYALVGLMAYLKIVAERDKNERR